MTDTGPTPSVSDLASDAHSIAAALNEISNKQGRNGALIIAMLVQGIVNVLVLVVLGIGLIPVIRTAHTVERVAGPDALARQQAESTASITELLTLILCAQRSDLSESRQLDGKDPLHLKVGCAPYDYTAPLLPTPTTRPPTPTTAKPHASKSTSTTHASSTAPPSTTKTSTTVTTSSKRRCPTVTLLGTCITTPSIPSLP